MRDDCRRTGTLTFDGFKSCARFLCNNLSCCFVMFVLFVESSGLHHPLGVIGSLSHVLRHRLEFSFYSVCYYCSAALTTTRMLTKRLELFWIID